MSRTRAALLAAAAAAWISGPAAGQSATDPGQNGAIQMQPLNALKPQPMLPGTGSGAGAGSGAGGGTGQNTGTGPSTGIGSGLGLGTGQGADTGVPSDNGGFVPDQSSNGGPVAPYAVPGQTTTTTTTEKVAEAKGATVRWLDKVSGRVVDMNLQRGQSEKEGRLTVTLDDCRYPVDDPASDAYAFLTIRDSLVKKPIFKGWMIASSPALNPLDSARYDVWVLRCSTS